MVDLSQPAWQERISGLAKSIIEKDIDGFFLDNTDAYYEYYQAEIFEGLIAMIDELRQYQKNVLVKGGDIFVT